MRSRFHHEEVDILFPTLEIDPIKIKTVKSPHKAGPEGGRLAQGFPLPNIWIPYKVSGEVQDGIYLYYSPQQLSESELSDLENDPDSIGTKLNELKIYSKTQSFDNVGKSVIAITETQSNAFEGTLINDYKASNIAGLKFTPRDALPSIRYLHEPWTDQPDDFFALRNIEHDWISKVAFCSTNKDEEGYMTFRFSFPPGEVETVDIIRGVHTNHSTGSQRISVLEENVPINELIG
ncbi:hypothetical protein [Vibrio azureus]|uniref:hypothetical protein n=1 Tax=Vibrio azureus TaxID=512649 RepID=UPI00039ACF8C|nr:hypothetical protein [Vibrio azureus]